MDITISVLDWLSQPVSHLSSIDQISATDTYIIERNHGSGTSLEHFNKKLTYSSLSARVLNDISARLNFNTMAYKDVWEYDLKSHEHEYSLVDVFPQYTSSDVIDQYSRDWRYTAEQVRTFSANPHQLSEWIGTVAIWQTSSVYIGRDSRNRAMYEDRYVEVSSDIYMPHIIFPKYAQPDIGELRFLARNSCPVCDSNYLVYDNQHDGYWAYPRGQTIACAANEFQDACRVYGNNGKTGRETSFNIPCLSNFIKLNPSLQAANALQRVEYQIGIAQHNHLVDETFNSDIGSQRIILTSEFLCRPLADYVDGKHAIHSNGNESLTNKYVYPELSIETNCTYNLQAVGSITNNTGTFSEEAYPKYNDLPVLIYIGRR